MHQQSTEGNTPILNHVSTENVGPDNGGPKNEQSIMPWSTVKHCKVANTVYSIRFTKSDEAT